MSTRQRQYGSRGPVDFWFSTAWMVFVLCLQSGCIWSPAIGDDGYSDCEQQDDCGAGRICQAGLCAPPAWNDDRFGSRQLFVVRNQASVPLAAGTPVAVRIGAGGLIQSSEFGVDGRFVYFDPGENEWQTLPAYRDVYDDFLQVFLPLSISVPPAEERQLAWLETRTASGNSNYLEDPERVFGYFDDFAGDEISSLRYRSFGTGMPVVEDGKVRIDDNQRLVGQVPFDQPFSLQARARINGVNCSRFFIGVSESDGLSYGAPSVGFFSNSALSVIPEIAPTTESVPRPVAGEIEISTAENRFRIDVGDGQARLWINDDIVAEPELRPQLENVPLYLRIEVDGACSVEVERVFVRPVPFELPVVVAEPRVDYEILR